MVKPYPSIVNVGDRYYYNDDPNTHNICIVTNIYYDTIRSKIYHKLSPDKQDIIQAPQDMFT